MTKEMDSYKEGMEIERQWKEEAYERNRKLKLQKAAEDLRDDYLEQPLLFIP